MIIKLLSFLLLTTFTYSNNNDQINVKNFGAKGDGKTDDYTAILAASQAIMKQGTGTLYFPKGVYLINVYHTKDNKLSNIAFSNCTNLNVIGEQAVINLKGDFTRTADYKTKSGKSWYSKTNAITPFSFFKCKNVLIKGFEVNGNVNLTKRQGKVAESNTHLLRIDECENVTVRNMYLHHAQTDGIYITGRTRPSLNVKAYDVISSNNGRQGMSVTGLNGGEFVNCTFSNTGLTGGEYGSHAPRAGVDIEPRTFKEYKTGNITFDSCVFENNLGSQFICTSPTTTENIFLNNCSVQASAKSSERTMTLSAVNLKMDGCKIDCKNGDIYAKGQREGARVEISNCEIKSARSGLKAISKSDVTQLFVQNNKLIRTSSLPSNTFFPYLSMKNLKFVNNEIFIPSGSMKNGQVHAIIQNARVAEGNKFYSEKKEVKPKVSYKGTLKVNDL